MGRRPQPWPWGQQQVWCVTLEGKRHVLGPINPDAPKPRKGKTGWNVPNTIDEAFRRLQKKNENERVHPESVAGILDEWLDFIRLHRAEKTYGWYKDFAQSFLDTLATGLKVCDLRVHHVQKWVDSHISNWSESTRHGAITTIKAAMRWALKQGYINLDPIAHMSKPPIAKRELLVPQKHYEYMLAKAKDQEFKDLLVTSWEVGARPQEIVTVEARHVDLERGLWLFPVEESKGKKVQRVVYLTDVVVKICKRLCEKHPNGPIYRNTEGNPWDGLSTSCRFRRFQKEKHLGIKYHLYAFRHTFATRCLQAGIDSVTLAVLMGHVDASMISRVYQHLAHDSGHLREVLRKVVRATASSFAPTS